MLGYILLAIFIWVMYNFVVKFVLPIYNTTQQIKSKFRDIQQKQETPNPQQTATKETASEKEGEYIEFEEVK